MKPVFKLNKWTKVFVFFVLAMLLLGKPESVRSGSPYQTRQYTTNELYQKAFKYAQDGDYVNAGKFLFAYTQRNPSKYANNVGGFKTDVDKSLESYRVQTEIMISRMNEVNKNIKACGRYQCDQSGTRAANTNTSVQPLPPPPDGVILCTNANYAGECVILLVGDYGSFVPMGLNDQVTSVMVGSQVKLTLFLHANLNSEFITFTSNDPDLSDNPYDSTYSWNDITSAARVQYR